MQLHTISLVDRRTGAVYNIVIAEGGNTGCAKLPFLFTAAVQEALKEVRQRHPTRNRRHSFNEAL